MRDDLKFLEGQYLNELSGKLLKASQLVTEIEAREAKINSLEIAKLFREGLILFNSQADMARQISERSGKNCLPQNLWKSLKRGESIPREWIKALSQLLIELQVSRDNAKVK